MDELIVSLKKALTVRERKVERKHRIRARLRAELRAEEDITKRIEKIMADIERRMQIAGKGKLKFRDLVEKWERSEVVDHFIPILHLEKNQKISTEQEEFFKEILISKQTEII